MHAGVYKESGHNLVISHFSCKLTCKLQLLLKNMTRRSEVQNKTFRNKDPINYPQNIYNMKLSVRDDVARTVSVLNALKDLFISRNCRIVAAFKSQLVD